MNDICFRYEGKHKQQAHVATSPIDFESSDYPVPKGFEN